MVRVPENRDPRHARCRFLEKLKTLSGQFRGYERHARHVATGTREAGDETTLNRIGTRDHHDRYDCRGPLGERCDIAARRDDQVGL